MPNELAKTYDPKLIEPDIYRRWIDSGAFDADPDAPGEPYCIVIPPPNVTAPLHLGHALNNSLQDVLVRFRRMQGCNTLWMPGTDHAGIATQTVVEKRLQKIEGKRRTDYDRNDFVARVQAWKEEFEARIIEQLHVMGCSCDWRRTRFTMDDICAKAVRETFFRLFADGLIYRGKRLVNWDPATQTVLADDEVEHQEVQGHFWYMRYPLAGSTGVSPVEKKTGSTGVSPVEKKTGSTGVSPVEKKKKKKKNTGETPVLPLLPLPPYVTVATTRPETMLGDTAVAMNPRDPRAKALVGQTVILPLVGREIPIIADEHVVLPDPESDDDKAKFSTGFLKVTPAHDPDDYAIGLRHDLPQINVMAPDGTISEKFGWDDAAGTDAEFLLGMDRFDARKAVVDWFGEKGLMEDVRDYTHEVGHSYRSHVPIEPYLSDQWYVAVKKPLGTTGVSPVEEGEKKNTGETPVVPGTDVPVNSLAGFALAPVVDGRVKFTPERYANTYRAWIENLRDWPISRQLWWGHRIPVWKQKGTHRELTATLSEDSAFDGTKITIDGVEIICQTGWEDGQEYDFLCIPPGHPEIETKLESLGWTRDEDVLDTWFSSALWPFSTLGWPDQTPELETYYPGDVLCTAREIITLWVSRMVMMGQYCVGDIPFTDVFIHAMIQDGDGQKMSKSLGNGVDPADIIHSHGADAMRFTLCQMTTQTQDVRMPVDLICPFTSEEFEPKKITTSTGARVAAPMQDSPFAKGRKMVSSYGAATGVEPTDETPLARNTSPKFDIGRNFCNKLWNAARFAMMNLEGLPAWGEIRPGEHLADRWILSRLTGCVRDVTEAIEAFRFNEVADRLYHFLWDDFCDWYLEIAKARIQAGEQTPKAVLAHVLDALLRLLHPIMPFITEAIWEQLNTVASHRSGGDEPAEPMLAGAQWPRADAARTNPSAEADMACLQELVRQVRNARTEHGVPPRQKVNVAAEADGQVRQLIGDNAEMLRALAQIDALDFRETGAPAPENAAAVTAGGARLYVLDVVDTAAELARLTKQAGTLKKGIAGITGKLGNDKFLAGAPPEVVQRERERLEKLTTELAGVEDALKNLE